MTHTCAHRHQNAGMSLLEVLLAVAMLGLLMIGGSTMLYALTRSYFSLETNPQFERHADGVSEMLHYLASISSTPEVPPGRHFEWTKSPLSNKSTLSFSLDKDVPFFVSEFTPLPPIKAFLEFETEAKQFWLVWYPDPKLTNNSPKYQYTLLSPWAGDIEYGYYDAGQKSWEFELASSENNKHGNQRPGRIHLIFDRGEGNTLRRGLDIQPDDTHVLLY